MFVKLLVKGCVDFFSFFWRGRMDVGKVRGWFWVERIILRYDLIIMVNVEVDIVIRYFKIIEELMSEDMGYVGLGIGIVLWNVSVMLFVELFSEWILW